MSEQFEYCLYCGEHVDSGYTEDQRQAPCDNCEEHVEPIDDADDAAMPFKVFHEIRCSKCKSEVKLVGLHMGQYTDGVNIACECMSLDSLPYELGEPDLPQSWEIHHDTVVFGGESDE